MSGTVARLPGRFAILFLLATGLISSWFAPAFASADAATPAGAQGASGTASDHHLAWDGADRLYRLYIPAQVANPAPLVVMMHGGGGSAQHAEDISGWDALADREGFIVAYPNADGLAWNAGSCCGRPAATGIDDVGFIEAMVREIETTQAIDPDRVYAAGMSNGAMMAYRLACESTIFAAIAPVAGTMMVACTHPSPISILHIHGLADHNVPFDGSRGDGFAQVDGPAIPDVIAAWRTTDRCDPAEESIDGAVTTSIASCAEGRAVELITIAGAGHQWPGADTSRDRVRPGADAPSTDLDATTTIWAFFAAHPGR